MGHYLGRTVLKVSIVPDDVHGAAGCANFVSMPTALLKAKEMGYLTAAQKQRLEEWVITLLAGGLAEKRVKGRHNHVGASSDYEKAADVAIDVWHGGRVADAWIGFCLARADELLDVRWSDVEKVAEALLEHDRLSRKGLLAII